jgi:hypothetical protein
MRDRLTKINGWSTMKAMIKQVVETYNVLDILTLEEYWKMYTGDIDQLIPWDSERCILYDSKGFYVEVTVPSDNNSGYCTTVTDIMNIVYSEELIPDGTYRIYQYVEGDC